MVYVNQLLVDFWIFGDLGNKVNDVQLGPSIWSKVSILKITQVALHHAWMVHGRVELDDSGVQPVGTTPVHKLLVDHGCLSRHSPVEMNHGYALLIGPNHPGLHNLTRHKLL